jgi:hypothetical protein
VFVLKYFGHVMGPNGLSMRFGVGRLCRLAVAAFGLARAAP